MRDTAVTSRGSETDRLSYPASTPPTEGRSFRNANRVQIRGLEAGTLRSPNEFRSDDIGAERFPIAPCRQSLRRAYVRRSTHCAREAGGSNGAPKTQVVLAILPDRISMMLITCQVTPSAYLAFPKNV